MSKKEKEDFPVKVCPKCLSSYLFEDKDGMIYCPRCDGKGLPESHD